MRTHLIGITILFFGIISLLYLTPLGVPSKNSTNPERTSPESISPATNGATITINIQSSAIVDVSDWQTYTNERCGFSFKYPGDWSANATIAGITVVNPGSEIIPQKIKDTAWSGQPTDSGIFSAGCYHNFQEYYSSVGGLTQDTKYPFPIQLGEYLTIDNGYYRVPAGVEIGGVYALEYFQSGHDGNYLLFVERPTGEIFEIDFYGVTTMEHLTNFQKAIFKSFVFIR